jgi:hypothetical protein
MATVVIEELPPSPPQVFADPQLIQACKANSYCFAHGKKLKDDVKLERVVAVHWWIIGAYGGNIFAQYQLAGCYEHGIGTEQDWVKATQWYHKAAQQGHEFAKIGFEDSYDIVIADPILKARYFCI